MCDKFHTVPDAVRSTLLYAMERSPRRPIYEYCADIEMIYAADRETYHALLAWVDNVCLKCSNCTAADAAQPGCRASLPSAP